MKYKINPKYEDRFKWILLGIKEYFKENNQCIHKARNELKILNYNEIDIVVKAFKVPNFINRLIYSYLRNTKASKSYHYALKIGDFTPEPIGYIEFYDGGLLKESYFLSKKFDYDFTIREPLLDENFEDRVQIWKQFAKFTYDLHQNGILHHDYSPGNILIKKEDENYTFKIVDINRMNFRELTLDERLQNFGQLWAKDEDLKIIITEYAKLIKEDEVYCIFKALQFSQKHKDRKNFKKRLKGKKVVD